MGVHQFLAHQLLRVKLATLYSLTKMVSKIFAFLEGYLNSTKNFSRYSLKEEIVFLMVFDSNARLLFFLYVLSNNTSRSTTKHDIQITAFAIRRRRSESDGGSLFFVRPHNAISLDLMNNEQRSSVCKAVFEMYSGYK